MLEAFQANRLDWSWCSERCPCRAVRCVKGHPWAGATGATGATGAQCVPVEGWSGARLVGQLRLLHTCRALTSWAAALPESTLSSSVRPVPWLL